MNLQEYDSALNSLTDTKEKLTDSYIGKWIPKDIELTLIELVTFIGLAKDLLFRNGQLMSLNLFNILKWWGFLKITYTFIKKIVDIWK